MREPFTGSPSLRLPIPALAGLIAAGIGGLTRRFRAAFFCTGKKFLPGLPALNPRDAGSALAAFFPLANGRIRAAGEAAALIYVGHAISLNFEMEPPRAIGVIFLPAANAVPSPFPCPRTLGVFFCPSREFRFCQSYFVQRANTFKINSNISEVDGMKEVIRYFPERIRERILAIPEESRERIDEIRIRIGRPVELNFGKTVQFLPPAVSEKEGEQLFGNLAKHSIYALEEELKRGYITVEGGHRVGLAGKVILENGAVKAIRDISSFNIRIAREKIGIADKLLPFLFDGDWKHTMIIGAPHTGKTTLLRDIARLVSTGSKARRIPPAKVGIVDERSEIAGCFHGIPQMTFGTRVDVLDGCPKAEGMMMMIRSMSPDVLIVDEIGRKEDTEAILEAVHAGIRLIMTTHGETLEELVQRPILKEIIGQKVFERFIELSKSHGPGTIVSLKDREGRQLFRKVSAVHD